MRLYFTLIVSLFFSGTVFAGVPGADFDGTGMFKIPLDASSVSPVPEVSAFSEVKSIVRISDLFKNVGKDTSHYFKNLKIWQCGEKYISEQGQRPVIYITFKDIKQDNYEAAVFNIQKKIATEFSRHNELETSNVLDESDKELCRKMSARKAEIFE